MRGTVVGALLLAGMYLSLSTVIIAKGSGGGHGSGHGGGHGGGHGSGAAAGHGGGGRSHAASRGARSSKGNPSTSRPSTNQTSSGGGHRDGQLVGTAVPRGSRTSPSAPPSLFVPSRFRFYYGSAFGLGLGYLSFPFYGYGYSGPGYGAFGSLPYGGYPSYGYGTRGYAASPFDNVGFNGSLRLMIKPRDAEVFVDGYYAGIVDDFDGHFQHLDLTPGPHHVQVHADGYQPLEFDVDIQFDHKTEYRGALTPLQPSR